MIISYLNMKERKNNVFGIVALIILSFCFLANLALFIPMLSERIKTGFGNGTNIEMGALIVWLFNGLSLVPLFVGTIFTIISIIKHDCKWRIITNVSLSLLTIIEMILTTVFMFI